MMDEEDIALSALASFFQGAARGQYNQLHDRDDLWHLLVLITTRKVFDLVEYQGAQKRSHGSECPRAPSSVRPSSSPENRGAEGLIDPKPPPDLVVLLDEECQKLIQRLGDAKLQAIAVWKLEGYTSEEIAGLLSCTVRTVERKLNLIRSIWATSSTNERPAATEL
jgi:DNA-directed RNA polymerase specialized sigma24 family protein